MAPVTMSPIPREPSVNEGDQIRGCSSWPAAARCRIRRTCAALARRRAPNGESSSVAAWRGRWRLASAPWLRRSARSPRGCGFGRRPRRPSRADVATFQQVIGTVVVTSVDQGRQTVTGAGMRLRARVAPRDRERQRAALVLIDGTAIRLDQMTVAVFESALSDARARSGYIDSGRPPRSTLRCASKPFRSVHHLGTRFEVRVAATSMRVRVREGLVAVERDADKVDDGRLERRWSSRPSGTPSRERIATSGPEWRWVGRLAEPFILEGATVRRSWTGSVASRAGSGRSRTPRCARGPTASCSTDRSRG